MRTQLEQMANSMNRLEQQVKALQDALAANGGGGGSGCGGGNPGGNPNGRAPFNKNEKPKPEWSKAKKTWWWNQLKEKFPAEYKAAMKERIERDAAACIAKLEGGD